VVSPSSYPTSNLRFHPFDHVPRCPSRLACNFRLCVHLSGNPIPPKKTGAHSRAEAFNQAFLGRQPSKQGSVHTAAKPQTVVICASMPRPTLTSRLSLPHRLKNGTPSNSVPTSRNTSPKRTMSDHNKPGLVLRVNVLKAGCPRRLPRCRMSWS
jgi:hypothetical protein